VRVCVRVREDAHIVGSSPVGFKKNILASTL
jgi:hypothetical protein